jgi:exodeoxyribonuclease V beta subunit
MVMFRNNLAYEASAGSGKTFMLVVRYLSLLFMGANPSKILALTFTNKAAREMQERVIETLEELQHRGELDEILKVTQLSKEYILSNRKTVLEQFLNANSKIMTIDSFFTQILRKFSLYVSLMPDFSTSASQHEIKLLLRFLKGVSVENEKETLITLSLESNKRFGDIFTLLDQFYIKKQELRHLNFKKENFKLFEDEALGYLEELKTIVFSCDKASSTAKKGVIAESFDELLKKAWLSRESFDYTTFKKCYTPQMDTLLHKIKGSIKNQNRAKEQNFFYALSKLLGIYEKAKKALYVQDGELSFSDVTALLHFILREIDDSEFLYFRLDSQIEHILLDEFQDTSILQYEILRPLIDEITSGKGIFENGSFFFVGDVKQSIYRFRGGVSALFDVVKEQQHTEVKQLLTNYRSQKEVIKFVNNTFKDKIKNYAPQKVKDGADGGYVEVIKSDETVETTMDKVKELISLGAELNDIAILCATNGDGETIKEALSAQNIEVVTETTTKLINQKSVKAVIEYLKYLYFGEDIYKYNFFALIGEQTGEMKRFDINSYSPFELVKKIIDEYKLFRADFHLMRFLNVISYYGDIEAFLFECERLDTEAAASDLRGVRVLTIHKSKGLEYEHVIVMDRLKKAPPSRDTIIYEYDNITLKNIYLRIKGREAVDIEYADAIQKDKELQKEDTLNALYVAFTRARQNLFVVMKSKDSMFEILDLVFGDSGVISLPFTPQTPVLKQEESNRLKYEELYYGTQSDILKSEGESEQDLKSINFGLAMHYMLEMLESFKKSSIPHAKSMMINRYGHLLDDEEIEDIQNRITMLLNSKDFQDLVDGEYCKEKALRYKNNLRYLDLLVKTPSGIWSVIDYKSSMNFYEHHFKQVRYYKTAVKEITGDEVDGYLCYLLKDEIVIKKVA